MKILIYVFCVSMFLAGCAATVKTTIYPTDNGTFNAISLSSDEGAALSDSIKKAKAYCKKRGKSYVVVSQHSTYSGVPKDVKSVANVASYVASSQYNTFVPTGELTSDDDNKIITIFKCK